MTIGIGLIGAGRAGMIHGRNFGLRVPGARMVAVSDPVEEARQSAAAELSAQAFATYEELLACDEVNAVVIVTPTKFHRDITLAAAAAGKHVLCEKPMAMSVLECNEMIASTEKAGVKLQVGFMRRFDPTFNDLKQRIDRGEVGKIVTVRSLTYGPSIPQPWMYDLTVSNGPLAEVSSHDIDTIRWLVDSDITEVYAIGGNYRSPGARGTYPDFYDNFSLVARFANGAQGMISGAQGVRYGYDARCEALGEDGILFGGSLQARAVTACTESGLASPVIKSWRDLFADAYRLEDEAFIQCIQENTTPRVTGLDGKRAVQVVNAGNESIRTGKPVKITLS